jgi:hypothetical protein
MEPYRGPTGEVTKLVESIFSTIPGSIAYVAKASCFKMVQPKIGVDLQLAATTPSRATSGSRREDRDPPLTVRSDIRKISGLPRIRARSCRSSVSCFVLVPSTARWRQCCSRASAGPSVRPPSQADLWTLTRPAVP